MRGMGIEVGVKVISFIHSFIHSSHQYLVQMIVQWHDVGKSPNPMGSDRPTSSNPLSSSPSPNSPYRSRRPIITAAKVVDK
jgi:hypothetical protein